MPAPHGLPDHIASATGGPSALQVRQLTTADRDRLAQAFARLSDRTRYLRFHAPKPKLSQRELTYFTEIDHITHEALVAVAPDDERLVGVTRYAPVHGEEATADFAIVIADEWQGRGLGRELARRIVVEAHAAGVERLTASTLGINVAARRLLVGLGFEPRGTQFGASEFEMVPARELIAAAA